MKIEGDGDEMKQFSAGGAEVTLPSPDNQSLLILKFSFTRIVTIGQSLSTSRDFTFPRTNRTMNSPIQGKQILVNVKLDEVIDNRLQVVRIHSLNRKGGLAGPSMGKSEGTCKAGQHASASNYPEHGTLSKHMHPRLLYGVKATQDSDPVSGTFRLNQEIRAQCEC
jgi:hypothetical protein